MRIFLTASLLSCLLVTPVSADEHNADSREPYPPTATEMIVDGLVMRPLSLAGTIIGTGIFLVTLPFSAAGGNVDEAGQKLVAEPARATFSNCLGCIPGRHERLQQQQRQRD